MRKTAATLAAAVLATAAFGATSAAAAGTGATYVGLGDSYSAGEGLTPYETGTDTSTDTCHRSVQAYGSLLAQSLGLSSNGQPVAGAFDFAACSGAVTNDLLNANYQNPEPAQTSHLGTNTKLVSLTIGGNDIGFENFVDACLDWAPWGFSSGAPGDWGCTASSSSLLINDATMAISALEGGPTDYLRTLTPMSKGSNVGTPKTNSSGAPVQIYPLVTALNAIHQAAPNAHIYLGGYPDVFGTSKVDYSSESSSGGSGYECDPDDNGFTMDYTDAQYMNGLANAWDSYEQSTVSALATAGIKITFVDPRPNFSGHANCDYLDATNSSQRWINWTSPTITGSFHPDVAGHAQGYEPAFITAGF